MDLNPVVRLSGSALCLAGLAYILDTVLDAAIPQTSPGLGALVPILGLVGFPGFWSSLRAPGLRALLAYVLGMLGLAGLVAVTFLGNRVFADVAPQVVSEILAAIGPEFIAIGVIFLFSTLLLLRVCWHRGKAQRTGAAFYTAGAIPVSLTPFMPDILVSAGGIAIGIGLLIWGGALLRREN